MTTPLVTTRLVTTRLVTTLEGRGLSPTLVGGKGAWLDRVVAEGFPVPDCVVLTTGCYTSFVAHSGLGALIEEWQHSPLSPGTDAAARTVDEAFLSAPLPERVANAITEAAAACTSTGATLLAVRSSATAEDMATMSFAGQYRSFLDVSPEGELVRAVRLVWASLWHPAPHAYRRFHGVDESGLAMAVVLMPMVAAESAGVAFSIDPREKDSVRVESVEGLGEQLVSGAVTPRVSLVPRTRAAGPAGEDDPLEVRVARLTVGVERTLGGPQDIEWAWDGRALMLLQARPIALVTRRADDGFDTPARATARWTTAGIAETLPGVLPPLRWATAGFLLEEAFRRLFDELDALPALPSSSTILGRFRARAALSLDVLEQMASVVPGGSPDDVERQYFGRAAGERPATGPSGRSARLRSVRRDLAMLRLRRHSSREAEIAITAAAMVVANEPSRHEPTEVLLRRRERLLDLSARTMAAEAAVAASAVASYRRLESWLLGRFSPRESARWAQRLTAHRGPEPWWRRPADDVAALVHEGLLDDESVSWAVVQDRLLATPAGALARDALLTAAGRAGSMAVFGGPGWDEDPELTWNLVWSASRVHGPRPGPGSGPGGPGGPGGPERVTDTEASTWDEFGESLGLASSVLSLPGRLPDRRLLRVRRLVDDAVELLNRRERTKAAVLALGGQVRRMHLELGHRLTLQGLLDRPEDIELLDEAELHSALEGDTPSRAELGRRRRWLDQCAAEEPLPERFEGRPTAQRVTRPGGTELHGWAAGPGVFTGVARVVRSPADRLGDGEVLVASSTDASWSPLFLRAGAIAVERGGPLSHAAIVARELGIPAVLNVPGLVSAFSRRTVTVTVDGDRGLITVLDGVAEPPEDPSAEVRQPVEEAASP